MSWMSEITNLICAAVQVKLSTCNLNVYALYKRVWSGQICKFWACKNDCPLPLTELIYSHTSVDKVTLIKILFVRVGGFKPDNCHSVIICWILIPSKSDIPSLYKQFMRRGKPLHVVPFLSAVDKIIVMPIRLASLIITIIGASLSETHTN